MKKLIGSVALASAMMVGFTGCGGGAAPAQQTTAQAAQVNPEFDGAPQWVLMPDLEGGLAAAGSAKMGAAGPSFAKTEATANARDELARQLNVKVKNMVSNFTQTTGVGDAQTVDKVVKSVSKQVAKVDLSGSKVAKVWLSKTNTMWVLVVVDPASVASVQKSMKEAAITSFKNDEALYQQFQAKKGAEALDAEIDKSFAKK